MDRLLTAMNRDHTVRLVAAITTQSAREASLRQKASEGETLVLSRALSAGCLLATLVKNEHERVHLRLLGHGPIRTVVVDGYNSGKVRACLPNRKPLRISNQPNGKKTSRPSTAPLLGTVGQVIMNRYLANMSPYEGSSDFVSGEIDEDIENYLSQSEQLPSALTCDAVLPTHLPSSNAQFVVQSAGILCQILPGTDPAEIAKIRSRFTNGALHKLLHHDRTPNDLVGFALGGEPFDALNERDLSFSCQCGPENAIRVLSTLGVDDLEKLASEEPQTEVSCSFCGDTEVFSANEIRELAVRLRSERS